MLIYLTNKIIAKTVYIYIYMNLIEIKYSTNAF